MCNDWDAPDVSRNTNGHNYKAALTENNIWFISTQQLPSIERAKKNFKYISEVKQKCL